MCCYIPFGLTKLKSFIKLLEDAIHTYDSLYFHITCERNIDSIDKNGLIDIKNNNNKIGDGDRVNE